MADVREQTGEGTLYDTNNAEVASTIAYRIEPGPTVGEDETTWGGRLFFAYEDEIVPPGLYVLELEDGTQVDIDINPLTDDGTTREIAFRGIGSFGQRIV
jgi:hypothetical protein